MSCVRTAAHTTASTCCTSTPKPSRSRSSSLALLALLFPGQASQAVGMGTDLREQFLSPRLLFELADVVSGQPVSQLCAEGPLERLTRTEIAQPAVVVTSL